MVYTLTHANLPAKVFLRAFDEILTYNSLHQEHSSLRRRPYLHGVLGFVCASSTNGSLVLYGGDDETTDEIGALGDLWVFSPKTRNSHDKDDELVNDWQVMLLLLRTLSRSVA